MTAQQRRARSRSMRAHRPGGDRRLRGRVAWALAAGTMLVIPGEVTAFERVDAIRLDGDERRAHSAVIDPTGAFAYIGTGTEPGQVVKIDLETFERVDEITMESGENNLWSAVIDPAGEFAYFGTNTFPGQVVKIDLATFERVDVITLDDGESSLISAVIDPMGAFAYFGLSTEPARVVKIDLETFERVGAITLESGENDALSAVIDPTGEFAYFGTNTVPGRVVKVDLETFERVDAISLDGEEEEDVLFSAVIDPTGAFAYFGACYAQGIVVKVDLEAFERVDAITLGSGESCPVSAVVDPTGEFAYFGTWTAPGRVVKIDLETFERVDAITLEIGENALWSAVMDPAGAFAYFGDDGVPAKVVKVGLLPPAPELSFDPQSLDFGDVEVGSTSEARVATLQNTSDADATELSLGGLPDSGFDIGTDDCGDVLPAAQSCEISIAFAPTTTGPADATLTAESAEGATAELQMAGNGVSETEVFVPMTLTADPEPLMELSDGNTVFEPGERVVVAPTWRNDGMFPQPLSGTASDFTGPDGPSYTVVIEGASYGEVDPGAIASCLETGTCYAMEIVPAGLPRAAPHWDAAFDETLSDQTTATWALHLGDSFGDVPRASLFYSWIETLLHHGVTGGCAAASYCPSAANTRGQMPVFLLKALEGGDYVPPECVEDGELFADVQFSSPFCGWIEELAERGVTAGCGGDNYCPDDVVSRGQMAVFLLKTLEGSEYAPPTCSGVFDDVQCPSLFADWIEDLVTRGVTEGCGGGNYCPGGAVSRGQMAVFLTKTFGLTRYGS